MNKKEKEDSIFIQEVKRDIATFKRLDGKRRLNFIYTYYKWKILGFLAIVLSITLAANALIEGHRPYRMRICVVLNNDDYCTSWFKDFADELASDGDATPIEVNEDQPFDYDNTYYYVQELEVMTTISSMRMDAAVCGPDMYDYLLALNACMPLDSIASAEDFDNWKKQGIVMHNTAGLIITRDGKIDDTNAVEGNFALDISDTEFGRTYNKKQKLDQGETPAPLYYVIISNTEKQADCLKLAECITR